MKKTINITPLLVFINKITGDKCVDFLVKYNYPNNDLIIEELYKQYKNRNIDVSMLMQTVTILEKVIFKNLSITTKNIKSITIVDYYYNDNKLTIDVEYEFA